MTPMATMTSMPTDTAMPTMTPMPMATSDTPRQNPAVNLESDPIADPANVFDPAGPTPENVVQAADPNTGEVNDSRLAGIVFKTQVRSEENPNDRNEVEIITPSGVAIFVISYENNTSNPLYGAVIRIVIPSNTTFRQMGSGLPLAGQIVAAGANVQGVSPAFEQSIAAINQNRGTEWELADLSGPCPDGAVADTECVFRLGTVQPSESGDLALPVTVNEDAPANTQFDLDSTIVAANLDEGLLITISDGASVEASIETVNTPTALAQEDEPLWQKIFLPLVSR